jgi:L-seryl-tRNA(Ser) seleniumtransferase
MNRFLEDPSIAAYAARFGTTAVKTAVGDVLREARDVAVRENEAIPAFWELLRRASWRLSALELGELVEVLNGTGVLLHTNLGRAPLAAPALAAMTEIAGGYSNLEFDMAAGTRGSRYERVSTLLRETTGAEDALVVNNCAAAVLLIVDTFAKSREVVVSRNQLIEIGGGFRLPDVLARSGARLVEVGATNKVYLSDFERALTPDTALLLRSHTSNYRIEGFTADVAPAELAALGRRVGVPTVEDLGGGALVDLAAFGLPHERTVPEAVADGIDLVAFSGDKLLGGPQCGIIVGRSAAIARMRANPLLRALRTDKATLAALAATLRLYLPGGEITDIPFYAMLSYGPQALLGRATTIADSVRYSFTWQPFAPDIRVRAVETEAFAGGGSAPLAPILSAGVAFCRMDTPSNAIAQRLRVYPRTRVIARTKGDDVIVDLRAIPPQCDRDVGFAIAQALS